MCIRGLGWASAGISASSLWVLSPCKLGTVVHTWRPVLTHEVTLEDPEFSVIFSSWDFVSKLCGESGGGLLFLLFWDRFSLSSRDWRGTWYRAGWFILWLWACPFLAGWAFAQLQVDLTEPRLCFLRAGVEGHDTGLSETQCWSFETCSAYSVSREEHSLTLSLSSIFRIWYWCCHRNDTFKYFNRTRDVRV